MKLLLAMLPTLLLTIYSQLIIKWRISELLEAQSAPLAMKTRLIVYLSDPYILSAITATFISGIAWFMVAEKYPVSIALPTYVGILFVLLLLGSAIFLGESVSLKQVFGASLILIGVAVVSHTHT